MMRRRLIVLAAALLGGAAPAADVPRWDAAGAGNPLLPGYFADPSIVHDDGRWYVFATIDPWGDDRLGLWTSDNGRDWRFSMPDWPTKRAATSPTSGDAKVWAPSVVKAPNGRWYMYVSVGSEVWVGTAPSPAGPWRDANGGKPLIARDFAPAYHMIDAEAFVDDDGQAYLYWGSGLNWVNGHCFVVRLKPDMVTFDGTPRDVTPRGYFEAPFMVKAGGRYLLTYSDGNTTKDTYKVRYAVGTTPFGPFTESPNSPILETHRERDIVSPGHHAIFRSGAQSYILYHRQALPWPQSGDAVLRQVAVDPIELRADGSIARVTPGHGGPVVGFAAHRARGLAWRASGTKTTPGNAPSRAADDNYATLWRAPADGSGQVIADLGRRRAVARSLVRPEYATRPYRFAVDASDDGRRWRPIVAAATRSGSPITLDHAVTARYLRLRTEDRGAGVWEWTILP
ncbi:glycosyl hydrolase [Sphingomonas sp. Leaf11]|uniref:family 43 glycosylhydrolase n=2 Tax=unclassified Sphingomonas TaxID=196159 RepID=UPI0006F837E1|nr:family 43 glycosylhydrolase [Sphingomonas sp. Leaf9]KQM27411.1 glycosyl hydrolase [Sphingomonas sp. Leaf9]KQM43748.1 glycosyl hydrolase [Sphingomonas sp. Leaf11]